MLLQHMTEVLELGFRKPELTEWNIMLDTNTSSLFYLASHGYKAIEADRVEKYIRLYKDKTWHYTAQLRCDTHGIIMDNTLYVPCSHSYDEPVKGVRLTLTKD